MKSTELKKLGIELPDTLPDASMYELISGTYPGHYGDLSKKTIQRIGLLKEIVSEYNQHSHVPELRLSTPSAAANYMRPTFLGLNYEESWIVLLNGRGRPIKKLLVSSGNSSSTTLDQKRIAKEAIFSGAISVILFHNHPSGDPNPSASDIETTDSLRQALGLFDIRLTDHIIISSTGDRFYSFADERITEFQ